MITSRAPALNVSVSSKSPFSAMANLNIEDEERTETMF